MPKENPKPFVNHPKSVSVAVLSLFSHALYSDKTKAMGGAERRAYYWLRMLQESGFSVSAVLAHQEAVAKDFKSRLSAPWPLYEHPKYRADGHIVRAKGAGTSLMSRLRDKFLSLFNRPLPNATEQNALLGKAVYQQIEADAYVAFGLTNAANELARFCADQGKRFIVSIAHDVDFDFLGQPEGKDAYDSKRELKAETLALAAFVVAQTPAQAQTLKQIGVPSAKIRIFFNPIEALAMPAQHQGKRVLWIGKSDANKNPKAVLELSKRLPQLEFCLIFGEDFDARQGAEFQGQKNIQVVSGVHPHRIRPYYLDSFCLLSTAYAEGFPNSFLEAWEAGIPIASLYVDPENLLSQNGLGFMASGNVEALAAVLMEWAKCPAASQEIGQRGRRYIETHHNPEQIRIQLEHMIKV